MDFKVSRYLETARSSNGRDLLVFSTRSGHLASVNATLWQEIANGNHRAIKSTDRATLIDATILVPANENEFATMMASSQSAISSSRTLARTIMVSSYCQLGCHYCGAQTHSNSTLDRALADKLVDDVSNQLSTGGYAGLRVTWFGGEPTTAPTVIDYLSSRLIERCGSTNASYDAQVITNGLGLTRELARRLVSECRVSHFIVSLDGVAEVHDRRRPTKTGKGSFDIIVQNLIRFVQDEALNEAKLTIRVNIGPGNAPRVHELIEELADLGFADRVYVNCAAVIHWNQTAVNDTLPSSRLAAMEVGWLAHLMSRGFKTSLLPRPRPSACLASEPASHVVATDGTIHNCTMTPLASHAITPSTSPLGHLDRGETGGHDAQRSILALLESKSLPCRDCTMLFLCQGGCPKDLESGLIPCPTFKFNLASRIALQDIARSIRSTGSECFNELHFASELGGEDRQRVASALVDHTTIFRRRFRLFRPPTRVVVDDSEAGCAAEAIETAKDSWHHMLLPMWAYDDRPSAAIIAELARRYLLQLNPVLCRQSRDGGVVGATEVVEGFVDWVTARLVPAAVPVAPSRVSVRFGSLARRCGIDQFIAQPADVAVAAWERFCEDGPSNDQQSTRTGWIKLQPVH